MSDDKFVRPDSGHRPRSLSLLAVVLFAEALLLAVGAGFLLFELVTVVPVSYGSAVSILVLAVAAAAWLVVLARATLKARPWVRAAALTWQVLQLAVALGSFQGLFARDDIGWFLLVPALVAIVLLFTKSVVAATRRE